MTNDTVVQIGSVLFNTFTNEVVSFLEEDSLRLVDADLMTRFLSVDPIGRKFPELTPYQFASNTPIQAIDLDGLEAFVIHGTKEYHPRFNEASLKQFIRITGNALYDIGFSWGENAGVSNSRNIERKISAEALVKYIEQKRSQLMKAGAITEKEPISLVGYSHGGNVAIQAADILYKKYNIKVNLLTISTPAYNNAEDKIKTSYPQHILSNTPPSSIVTIPNSENPGQNVGINAHTHIVHEEDGVVMAAGGEHGYKGSKLHDVNNNLISKAQISITNPNTWYFPGIESPASMRYHTDGLSTELAKLPVMKPAPIPTGINQH